MAVRTMSTIEIHGSEVRPHASRAEFKVTLSGQPRCQEELNTIETALAGELKTKFTGNRIIPTITLTPGVGEPFGDEVFGRKLQVVLSNSYWSQRGGSPIGKLGLKRAARLALDSLDAHTKAAEGNEKPLGLVATAVRALWSVYCINRRPGSSSRQF